MSDNNKKTTLRHRFEEFYGSSTNDKGKQKVEVSKDFDIDSEDEDYQIEHRRILLREQRNNTDQKKKLAIWAKIIVSVWLLLVWATVFFNGIFKLQVSDLVLSVLLGTTTFNVLGLMMIVLRGHFKK